MLVQKVLHQNRQIVHPLTQRGQGQRDHVETEVKIFAEFPGFHHLEHTAVGGGHHPDIHLDRFLASDLIDFMFLQYSKQFCLKRQCHFTDLVKKNGSGVSLFEFSTVILVGTGESPFLVTKKFTLQQSIRQCGTIDCDKGFPGPLRVIMDVVGKQFLPGSAFTLNQDRRLTFGNILGYIQEIQHFLILGNDFLARFSDSPLNRFGFPFKRDH